MFSNLKTTAATFLRQGLSPASVAVAIAVGAVFGVFPIYGPVSLLCLAVVWLAHLNAPTTFAAYYSMALMKPLLIIPFLRLGEWLFRAEPMSISLVELTRRFGEDAMGTLKTFGWSFLHAAVGWLVVAPFLLGAIYLISRASIHRWHSWRNEDVAVEQMI